jgi:hypothetical protein
MKSWHFKKNTIASAWKSLRNVGNLRKKFFLWKYFKNSSARILNFFCFFFIFWKFLHKKKFLFKKKIFLKIFMEKKKNFFVKKKFFLKFFSRFPQKAICFPQKVICFPQKVIWLPQCGNEIYKHFQALFRII